MMLRYWGKAKPLETSATRFHLLVCHCLDVAAVASAWWDHSAAIRHAFQQALGLPEQTCKAWVLFFIALHDLGKFDIRFQLMDREVFAGLNGPLRIGSITPTDVRNFDHGKAGLFWFHADGMMNKKSTKTALSILDMLDELANEADTMAATPWIEAVCGHHGFLFRRKWQSPEDFGVAGINRALIAQDHQARLDWITACEALFLKPLGLQRENVPALSEDFQPFLAGFCSVCDWLGSRSEDGLFQYHVRVGSLPAYFDKAVQHDAPAVLTWAGMWGKAHAYGGVRSLLAKKRDSPSSAPSRKPRQVQALIDDVPLAPGLMLLEGPTGCGKTEAALALAWRMVSTGIADSIVLALPTQATSNAMFERIRQLADIMFVQGANVVLAHGKAACNPGFAALKDTVRTVQGAEEAWVQGATRLAQSDKQAFLGQIGICSIDQVLISVLPVKHRFVRGFGLGRSVLIVDEVHASDTYMNMLLAEVLKKQSAAGGSAILLSATLHSALRAQFVETWGAACSPNHDYPLLTWCPNADGQSQTFTSQNMNPVSQRKVHIECVAQADLMPDDALLARIVAAAEAGAQVGIVCNLVDDAQAIHERLRIMTTQPVILFHSRFTYRDRQKIEESLAGMFGPDGDRSTGRILVGTQVLEQSVDMDMDWLVTQLCPVDLLFQRMGRMHRHDRKHRPSDFAKPQCTLIVPADESFGRHGKIYDNAIVMWRTWQKCLAHADEPIVFPAAYRAWMETIYMRPSDGSIPMWVKDEQIAYENHEYAARSRARTYLNHQILPVADTDSNVMAITRDSETSLTVTPYRVTVQGRALRDGTLLDSLNEAERGEALSLNTIPVPAAWKSWLPAADHDGVHWLPMEATQTDDSLWQRLEPRGAFGYDGVLGLTKERQEKT